jgi:hypothetical protein
MIDFLKTLLPAPQPDVGDQAPPGYMTPEAMKQMREMATALMPGGGVQQPVHHWTQGLSNMANALVGARLLNKVNAQQRMSQVYDAGHQYSDFQNWLRQNPGVWKPGGPTTGNAPTTSNAPTSPLSFAPEGDTAAAPGGDHAIERAAAVGGPWDRTRFGPELDQSPALRMKILRIMANEQGRHPQGTQAIAESLMNRANLYGTSLARQATWFTQGGYYDDRKHPGGIAVENDPDHYAILSRSLNNALGGADTTGYATDNASGKFARDEERTRKFIRTVPNINGETFFRPGWGAPGAAAKYEAIPTGALAYGEDQAAAPSPQAAKTARDAVQMAGATGRGVPTPGVMTAPGVPQTRPVVPNQGGAPMAAPFMQPGAFPFHIPVSPDDFTNAQASGWLSPEQKAVQQQLFLSQGQPITVPTFGGNIAVWRDRNGQMHQQYIPSPQSLDVEGVGKMPYIYVPDPNSPTGMRAEPQPIGGGGASSSQPTPGGPQPPIVGPAQGTSKLEQRARELQQQPQRAPGLPQFVPPSPPPKAAERPPTAPATAPPTAPAPAKALPYAEPDADVEPPQQRLQIPKAPEAKVEEPKAVKVAQSTEPKYAIPDYVRRLIQEKGTLSAEQEMKKGLATGAAKSLTDDYSHTISAGQASSQMLAGPIRTMWTALNSPNFYSGFGGDVVLRLKQVGAALGFKNAAEATELFKKAQADLSLDGLRQKLGGWGAGQIRLAEIHLVNNANANINNSIAANKVLMQIAERVAQRSQQMALDTQDYAAHHGGMVDPNWRLLMQQVYNGDTNPLFSDEEIQNMYNEMSADPYYKMPEVQGGKGAKGGPAPTGPGAMKPGTFTPPPPPPPGYK